MKILTRAKEIYDYREMVYNLVRRDLHGRYKRSFFGFAWTFLNPLLQLIVYTIVFSTIMRAGIDKFYLFLFVALIPWTFFSASLTGGCGSVLAQGNMVKKIYFPREVLPIAYVTTSFVNMLYCFVVVFAVVAVSGVGFNLRALLCLPFVMLVEYVICLGVALLTSAVTVYCRDLEYMLGIVSMLWMYLTPVLYPISMVPRRYLPLFMLNPMTPVITAYRDILYAAKAPELSTLLHSLAMGVLVLGVGWYVFEKLQRGFAEEL
ncbi:ABC transporter permease [Pyramidobacter sp.]|uniref:ABC transporter permease n=1 Tax=Pyramidobacter sp. TaxID=1943581 RepID=UPI00331F3876